MNALAGANVPFLFIVDYAQEQSHIEPLDRIDPATCLFQFPKAGNTETAATALARSTAARCAGPIQWDITPPSPAAYRHSFDLVKQNLLAGNSYLTNLTCRVPVTTNLTLEEIFLHSEALYKLWLKDRFVCFSPEIFVRIEKGKIKSFPMKGTIDATLPDAEQLLMQDTKEAAEHATIVDLIRNDLSMVSEHVEVTSYRYIDRLQTNKAHPPDQLRDMRHPARRLHRTPGRHHLPPASCRLHHRCPQAQNRRNHRPGRGLPPGLLHRASWGIMPTDSWTALS